MGDSTRWLLVLPPRAHSGRTRACGVPKNGVARESFVMATDACMLFDLRAGYVGTKPADGREALHDSRAGEASSCRDAGVSHVPLHTAPCGRARREPVGIRPEWRLSRVRRACGRRRAASSNRFARGW